MTKTHETFRGLVHPVWRGVAGFCAVLLVLAALGGAARTARACGGPCDTEWNAAQEVKLEAYINAKHIQTRTVVNLHTDIAFQIHELWMVNVYFKQYLLTAMMMMANQLSGVALQQMEIIGTFLDAKHQLETQRLYGRLTAQADQDYYPSEGMCSIGTAARNLPGAERDGDMVAFTLSRRSMERQLMEANSLGGEGRGADNLGRITQFKKTYCDKNDADKALASICASSVPAARKNKDVDFTRTLWSPLSLDVNFNNTTRTDDEEDLIALETNLYANDLFEIPVSAGMLRYDSAAPESTQAAAEAYMLERSIIAKHMVAENSFQALAAMKAAGSPSSTAKYLQAAVQELNPSISASDAEKMIGKSPSYYAMMDILTQKLLQNPQFFTNLYDTPANVARKGVALEAIGLIQARDNFETTLRSEMLLSQILELQLDEEQSIVQNRVNQIVGN